ncbi:MAG TPA: hypothetical protein VEG32_02645 [Clostridia bacterium]|nr:hypothetical protein [Clostridia bacterium]
MDQTLRQVGELLLGAVPTVVLLLLLYAVYHFVLHRPLQRVLQERRERTQGAIERARADIAAAEAKAAQYEERLRDAKLAIFRSQESRRQQAQQARTAAVAQARQRADEQVKLARTQLQQDVEAAKVRLQSESERLANEIIRAILAPAGSHVPAVGGQQ